MRKMVPPTRRPSVSYQTMEMRVRLGLTQEELASTVGVPKKDIEALERGYPVALDCKRMVLKTLFEQTTIRKHLWRTST